MAKANPQDQKEGQRDDEQSHDSSATSTSPLTGRVFSSASGLVRDALNLSPNDLPASLARTLGDSEKAGSSRHSYVSAVVEASSHGSYRSRDPLNTSNDGSSASGSFRSSPHSHFSSTHDGEIEKFQRANSDSSLDLSDTQGGRGKGKGPAEQVIGTFDDRDTAALERTWDNSTRTAPLELSAHQGNAKDGLGVVELLSDPAFQPQFWSEEMADENEDEDKPYTISAGEAALADKFNAAVAATGSTDIPSKLNSSSLIPGIDTFLAGDGRILSRQQPRETPIHDSVSAAVSPAEAIKIRNELRDIPGIEEWLDVADNYHDDVWGYLKPYIEAARTEVAEASKDASNPPIEGPAVRRLKMILSHVG